MKEPSYYEAFQVLLLQAADDGRDDVLFGDSFERTRAAAEPFLFGEKFPSVYLEFPLAGDPFLDVTILYGNIDPDAKVMSDAAAGTERMLAWFSEARRDNPNISCGFELDTKEPELPRAAVHFQPRSHAELVMPFCEAAGESERGKLYLAAADRMPHAWPLSFFGMFRGRPDSPLRICGYLDKPEIDACAKDPGHVIEVFESVGFKAFDGAMAAEVSEFMAAAPGTVDFQFDIYPDGSMGDTFAIDVQFEIEQPALVRESFETGPASRIMGLMEDRGIADARRRLVADAAFARALPMQGGDGSIKRYGFTLMPQWAKVRWRAGTLQPAKLYHLANAGFVGDDGQDA